MYNPLRFIHHFGAYRLGMCPSYKKGLCVKCATFSDHHFQILERWVVFWMLFSAIFSVGRSYRMGK